MTIAPNQGDTLAENKGYDPDSRIGGAGRKTNVIPHTTPKTMLQLPQHVDDIIREPIRANMGHTSLSGNSDNYTPPIAGRLTLTQFLDLARELRTRAQGQREKVKLQRFRSKSRLAQVRAGREGPRTSREGEGPPTLRKILRKGRQMYETLTNPAGRDVHGKSVVSSRLIPVAFTRRSMIGAAMCLERELNEGKVLPSECPWIGSSGDERDTSAPMDADPTEQAQQAEHLNLITGYNVELHSKLMQAEENRAHMRSYINFEHEAEGDDDLGEHDPAYDTTELPSGPNCTGSAPVLESTETMYIPPDIRGEDILMSDGRTLKDWLTQVCETLKPVFNTKVRLTPARVTPMRLEVDENIWNDGANSLQP